MVTGGMMLRIVVLDVYQVRAHLHMTKNLSTKSRRSVNE